MTFFFDIEMRFWDFGVSGLCRGDRATISLEFFWGHGRLRLRVLDVRSQMLAFQGFEGLTWHSPQAWCRVHKPHSNPETQDKNIPHSASAPLKFNKKPNALWENTRMFFLISPVSKKIGARKERVQNFEIGECKRSWAWSSMRGYFGGAETWETRPKKNCGKNSLEGFAEKSARNSLKICQTKLKNSAQIRSACRTSDPRFSALSFFVISGSGPGARCWLFLHSIRISDLAGLCALYQARVIARPDRNVWPLPKGPSRAVFSTESDSVVFYYSVVKILRAQHQRHSCFLLCHKVSEFSSPGVEISRRIPPRCRGPWSPWQPNIGLGLSWLLTPWWNSRMQRAMWWKRKWTVVVRAVVRNLLLYLYQKVHPNLCNLPHWLCNCLLFLQIGKDGCSTGRIMTLWCNLQGETRVQRQWQCSQPQRHQRQHPHSWMQRQQPQLWPKSQQTKQHRWCGCSQCFAPGWIYLGGSAGQCAATASQHKPGPLPSKSRKQRAREKQRQRQRPKQRPRQKAKMLSKPSQNQQANLWPHSHSLLKI